LGVHRDGPDDIASHLDIRVEEDQEIALFNPSRNLYETCDLLENAEWSIPPSCVLTRSGSGARAEVRHEDAVHVGVHRGVGITFDSIDALSTMGPCQFALKDAKILPRAEGGRGGLVPVQPLDPERGLFARTHGIRCEARYMGSVPQGRC
jgi:hypothetical protein